MDGKRTVAGLDVHKDSIYLCIMQDSGMPRGVVRTQAEERCEQRTLQEPQGDTRKQIPQTDPDRDRMGRLTDTELLLLELQLRADHGK